MPTDEYYHGKRGDADILIPLDIWRRGQADLTPVESVFRELADVYGGKFLGNVEGRVPTPSRGLEIRRGLTRHELRIRQDDSDDEKLVYVLGRTDTPPFASFLPRSIRYAALRSYTPGELKNQEKVRQDVAAVLQEIAGRPASR